MTNRNRSRAPGRRQQRTSRRTWVNQNISANLTTNTIQIVDLLQAAPEFMLFDTTILRVILDPFFATANLSANQLIRQFRYAIFTGIDTLDSDDVPTLFANTIGPTWMHVGGNGSLFSAVS